MSPESTAQDGCQREQVELILSTLDCNIRDNMLKMDQGVSRTKNSPLVLPQISKKGLQLGSTAACPSAIEFVSRYRTNQDAAFV